MAAKGAYNINAVRYYLNQHCKGSRNAANSILHLLVPIVNEDDRNRFNYWLAQGHQSPKMVSVFLLALYLKDSGIATDDQLRSIPPDPAIGKAVDHNADQLANMDSITREVYTILTGPDKSTIGPALSALAQRNPTAVYLPQSSWDGDERIGIRLDVGAAKQSLDLNNTWSGYIDGSASVYPVGYWIDDSCYAVAVSKQGSVFFINRNDIRLLVRDGNSFTLTLGLS